MPTPKTLPAPSEHAAQVTYRDTVFTTRVLILPGDRQLPVARSRVSVPADDTEALQYLDAHPDFKPLPE
ncbi:hypothetical protein [Pseudomonas putida]|uniref:hypothetical protein n=1 Tax=Pseudomonas putida TaxID=303 RepID=UPI0035A3F967